MIIRNLSQNVKKVLLSVVLLLALTLFGYSLRAQTTIGFMTNYGFVGLHDTVYSGQQYPPLGAFIVNNSDSVAFNDSISVTGYIDTGMANVPLPSLPSFHTVLYPGDSIFVIIPVDFRDTFMGGLFRIGGNVIVVWPAITGSSSSFNTGDSLVATVFVIDTLNSIGPSFTPDEQVRCYPVPAQGLLYITSASPSYHVKEATVYDLTGRFVAYSKETSMGINTEPWPPGIYILDVVFDNGTRRIYKIARK